MLFNSYAFVLLFLPLTLIALFVVGRRVSGQGALWILTIASLIFYGWSDAMLVVLLAGSVVVNFGLARLILDALPKRTTAKWIFVFGVIANLTLLGYFKYRGFFLDTLGDVSGNTFDVAAIALPIGISFYTLQQIAYLYDTYANGSNRDTFSEYALFVTFFPQLIAGPIVNREETIPQFRGRTFQIFDLTNFQIGLAIFVIGLAKKVLIADSLAPYANDVFDGAAHGEAFGFIDAWSGTLAYTFQLYFDFSGYSDMAIGLARMMNIRLPTNFDSPYKAANIQDFWRRWHVTLSRFIAKHIYIPLGGNRSGAARQSANVMIAMVIGGFWHGAGWTFICWGALHGFYIAVYHVKRRYWPSRSVDQSSIHRLFGMSLTFYLVAIGWVFFRAADVDTALQILAMMHDLSTLEFRYLELSSTTSIPLFPLFPAYGPDLTKLGLLLFAFVVAMRAPNTLEITERLSDSRATLGLVTGALGMLAFLRLHSHMEFLYFQF